MRDETVFVLGGEDFADECTAALYPAFRVVGNSEAPADARRLVREWQPGLVLVDADGLERPLPAAQAVAGASPDGLVFLVATRPTPDLVRGAVAVGVREVLARPLSLEDVRRAIQEAEAELRRRLRRNGGVADGEAEDEEGEGRRRGEGGQRLVLRQQLIAVYSPKGGTGKTTMALNLAAAYQALGGSEVRVLLVELDPYGNLPVQLQWGSVRHTTGSWRDVDSDGAGLGWPAVEALVNRDGKTGGYILPAPANPVDGMELDADVARRILLAGRRHFDVVVADCASDLSSDPTLVALQMATRVLVVVTPELPALNRVAGRGRVGELLVSDVVGVDAQRIRIVLNRVQKRSNVPLREIVRRLPFRLGAVVPEDPLVQAAANVGKVPVLAWPGAPFSREVRRLAGAVAPSVVEDRPRGLLARLSLLFKPGKAVI